MKMENERLCIEISEHGAEVTRIYDKKKETELLWEGNPTYWKRHSPILFPNVGKTYKNKVKINGISYPTSGHGFARDNDFKCICTKPDKAAFLFSSGEETKEVYPFDFELIVTYILKENSLIVKWEVHNTGDDDMYFTIGGHPAFRFQKADEKKTQADGFIREFPNQYETMIVEGGNNVSGGQKQRLCIARALLKKPKILILDDSTSAVDTKTDALIRQAFREEIPDTTRIIIAQRVSSVEDADVIIVMDKGEISGIGTSEELLKTNAIYREVYESQMKGGKDSE